MSYLYPQDRLREHRETGEQPYEDAREALSENDAEIRREAGRPHDEPATRSTDDVEHDAEERFEDIGDDVRHERDSASN